MSNIHTGPEYYGPIRLRGRLGTRHWWRWKAKSDCWTANSSVVEEVLALWMRGSLNSLTKKLEMTSTAGNYYSPVSWRDGLEAFLPPTTNDEYAWCLVRSLAPPTRFSNRMRVPRLVTHLLIRIPIQWLGQLICCDDCGRLTKGIAGIISKLVLRGYRQPRPSGHASSPRSPSLRR